MAINISAPNGAGEAIKSFGRLAGNHGRSCHIGPILMLPHQSQLSRTAVELRNCSRSGSSFTLDDVMDDLGGL